ncbi:PREDICTED: uncharacterized protein LOC106743634 isoform X2 [Dinoponera quadriceps]|uniref:Uncharacterized protein LOC106743634 isoform X2 n=1 Tax=Dinoponera quadriceps TaxID=609295 RepID=A0A6P3X4J0_DINQU|nr:PREDICTED: uncharacterized protein LOC106743634 isoform X2 [Dinoponera quadriceps]
MLVPPVAQSATGDRPVGDTVARAQQTTGPAATTTLWPLAPAQPNQVPNQQTQGIPSLAATPAPAHNQGANRYGLYSLFPGGGGGSYVAATPATPGPPASARAYHATTHKVSESVFSAAVGVGVGGYTWGAPTPPPGSPYSPVPVTQLELLAKNLANLAPAGQQALSLQGVGVNVGSLHHAQHTQHTQHTLNLTGLHHLHHGGLHQNAFSPQLSLVTGSAPTLTINSFSSPNSTNGVAPTTGVLLQEYQSPTGTTGCTVTVNGPSGLTSSTTSSSMVMHGGGQVGGQAVQAATKKREAFLPSQGQPVKLENKSTRTSCLCRNSNGIVVSNAGAGGIPVGIAVARQRLQHQETSTSMRNVSLSHHTSHHASYHHFQPDSLGSSTAMAVGGTTLVHCGGPGGEDRAAHLTIPSGALAPSLNLNSSLNSSLNSTLGSIGTAPTDTAATWPPTLWQYPATAAAAMPTEPLNFPQMGVGLQGGLQLVRDPASGHLLLIHAAEQMQQAVVWPNYASHGGNVAPPPLLLPPPPPSIQVLGDIGGARLVLAENKRKPPSALPIVKIEADCSSSPTTIISTSTESTKALQAVTSVTGALVPEAPLVTTLHYYPHAPALVQINPPEPTHCRSQATSPVSCLTPPPEVPTIHAIEPPLYGVQDASNQTDTPEDTEELAPLVKQEQSLSPCQVAQPGTNMTTANFEIVASPERICNVVRITTTTTTVNPICGIVTKVDKAENTIINMADCAKYSSAKECRSLKAIDRTADEEAGKEEKAVCRERSGARIIEITEENCDSFHENLEFFARRRDVSAGQRDRRDSYSSKDDENVGKDVQDNKTEIESRRSNDIPASIEAQPRQPGVRAPEPRLFDEQKPSVDSTESSAANCESCDSKKWSASSIGEARPHITVKSFDMPNIDCDEQEVQQVVIKQEADDSCYEEVCYESQCEPTSTSERLRPQEPGKRHPLEKSHPGIENVVEKLKKNAAALQEAAPPAQKVDESAERSPESVRSRRHSETIPKKLHILRSCASSLEAVDAEVSSSQISSDPQTRSGRYSPHVEDHVDSRSLAGGKCDSSKSECLLSDNNNDSRSNNNNIKAIVDKKLFVKSEKTLFDITGHIKPKTIWSCEMPLDELHATRKAADQVAEDAPTEARCRVSEQKPTVDVSGLELLSNSIEQLEQGIGQLKHPDADELLGPQNENNNNKVSNPLVLLCELAEQKLQNMEEVSDDVSEKLSLESSEEISHAGRLLLNLGRSLEKDGKRKYPEADDHHSKRFKLDDREEEEEEEEEDGRAGKRASPGYYEQGDAKNRTIGAAGRLQEEALLKLKESTVDDFSAENTDNDVEEEEEEEEEQQQEAVGGRSFRRNVENRYANKLEPVKGLQVISSDESRRYDACYEKNVQEGSKSDDEVFEVNSLPEQPSGNNEVECKRQASVEERDQKNTRAKKFAGKKDSHDNDNDWPHMNAMELDMRVRMANIQRQYRETQKELSKLIPRKEDKKNPGRPRKKSHSSSSEHGALSSPPALDVISSPQKSPPRPPGSPNGAPPPLASAVLAMPMCNVNLVKLGEPRSHIKLLDSIPSIPIPVPPVTSPITVLPSGKPEDDEKIVGRLGYETSSPAPTIASSSSASKKRKVGRPKKFMCTSGNNRHLTETIVAKKPKSKSSLVGYVLSSKNRHLQTKQYISKTGYTPLPFKSGVLPLKSQSKAQKIAKTRTRQATKPAKQTPLHNKNVISSIIAEKAKLSQEVKLEKNSGKVKPKLRAEAMLKKWEDDETDTMLPKNSVAERTVKAPADSPSKRELRHERSKKKRRKSSASSSISHDRKKSKRCISIDCQTYMEDTTMMNPCKLTATHLATDQLRVLQMRGGLFYAGRLRAVQPPDVYSITLDGERGNKPQFYSTEQILKDSILEVFPNSTKELTPGTRLCAYWSEQYRCLYPGTAVEPIEPNTDHDDKYVSVEFDDGDSGRIDLSNIRLLPPGYPVIEYDPNPLLTLGKRRRQRSSSGEKLRSASGDQAGLPFSSDMAFPASYYPDRQPTEPPKSSELEADVLDAYRERKRTKKRKRKLKRLEEGKKKHRKHKSSEEHRKHRHRKHRKHKHKHHGSHSEASYVSGESSSAEQKSEEEVSKEISSTVHCSDEGTSPDGRGVLPQVISLDHLPSEMSLYRQSSSDMEIEEQLIEDTEEQMTEEQTTSLEIEGELSSTQQNIEKSSSGEISTDRSSSEKMSSDRSSSEQMNTDRSSSGRMSSTDRSSSGQMNTDRSSSGRMSSTDRSSSGQMSADRSSSGQMSADRSSSGQISTDRSSSGQMSADRSSSGQISTDRSSSEQQISTDRSSSERISTDRSSSEQINTDRSSVGRELSTERSSEVESEKQPLQEVPSSLEVDEQSDVQSLQEEESEEQPSQRIQTEEQPAQKVEPEEQTSPDVESEEPVSTVESSESWEPAYEKKKKQRRVKRQTKLREKSVESRSKMAPFLPEKQIWSWADGPYRRVGAKGRFKKQFHRGIARSDETIEIGDSAVFLSTSSADRPYIGQIMSMWETSNSNMIVKVKWYYHPEERKGSPENLKYPGGLFESNHLDENDVQTISHKCEVLSLDEYIKRLGKEPDQTVYENKDVYYLAGTYDPTTCLTSPKPGVV